VSGEWWWWAARRRTPRPRTLPANGTAAPAALDPATLLATLDAGVVACDRHGRVTLVNGYAHRLHGTDPAGDPAAVSTVDTYETDGRTPLPPDRLPLARALREGTVTGVEYVLAPAGARRLWVAAHGRAVPATGGAVVVLHDISERHEGEQALRAALSDLERFAGAVSHDLKSPLVAVSGYAQLLRHLGATRSAEYDEFVGEILKGVETMRTLVDSHLAYASAGEAALEPADVDLAALADDVLATRVRWRRDAGEPVPVAGVGPLPPVHADAPMLRQVLDNLVGNALKYLPPGHTPQVEVTGHRQGDGWVRVEVADRGIGVPDDQREAIFTSFHRAHRGSGYQGTGLGLAICRRIVERHGGEIGCAPNPGGGTRFWFTLPAARTAVAPRQPQATEAHEIAA
jgi:signal transduction histidine kinase